LREEREGERSERGRERDRESARAREREREREREKGQKLDLVREHILASSSKRTHSSKFSTDSSYDMTPKSFSSKHPQAAPLKLWDLYIKKN
jgi:hypothetical protein